MFMIFPQQPWVMQVQQCLHLSSSCFLLQGGQPVALLGALHLHAEFDLTSQGLLMHRLGSSQSIIPSRPQPSDGRQVIAMRKLLP